MQGMTHAKKFLLLGFIGLLISGCSAFLVEKERVMEVQDIINMTKAGIDSTVIIHQIRVTHSKFKLDPLQIIQLKKGGVNDRVIEVMIETGAPLERFGWEYGYFPHDYWFSYYYYYQWNPIYQYYPWFYPYVYPYTGYPYYVNQYTGIPKSKHPLIGRGRFYPYVPVYPPTWDFKRHGWVYPREGKQVPEEKDK